MTHKWKIGDTAVLNSNASSNLRTGTQVEIVAFDDSPPPKFIKVRNIESDVISWSLIHRLDPAAPQAIDHIWKTGDMAVLNSEVPDLVRGPGQSGFPAGCPVRIIDTIRPKNEFIVIARKDGERRTVFRHRLSPMMTIPVPIQEPVAPTARTIPVVIKTPVKAIPVRPWHAPKRSKPIPKVAREMTDPSGIIGSLRYLPTSPSLVDLLRNQDK